MRHLSPGSPDAYLSIASAQLLDNRLDAATIALVQALLLDNSRQETIRLLVDIYRQTDQQGCAIVFSAGEPKLNVDCAQVRNDICRAYGGLAEVFVAAKQLGLAREIRDTAVREYRCNKAAFDRLLPAPKINLDLAP